MKRKTIFLDLDGVILDVSERIYRVYKNILKKYNKKFLSKDKYLKLKREKTSIEEILEKTKAEDIAIKFKREWDKEIEKPDYLALDKVSYLNKKTLLFLKNNWNLILVTLRKHPKRLLVQLKNNKINKIFDKVLVPSKKSQKPKWKIKSELIKKYNRFDKTSAIIVGDTETDILTGKNLGIRTVAIFGEGGMRSKAFLKKYKPDMIIKNLFHIKKIKMSNKEKNRLKKVAKWYKPAGEEIESIIINYRLDTILPNLKGPKVLEMGCSTGVMTKRLARTFPKLTVIDGSKKYIDYVKKIVKAKDVNFIVSLFEDFKTKEKFDDIILANALEHVKTPVSILKKAKNWLEKQGRIHIIVPNAESLHRRIGQKMGILKELKSFSKNDIKIGHRRVYTKKSLENDVERAGLHILKSQGIFLKPFSHSQMGIFDKRIFNALYEIGKELPDYCSSIYFICKTK